MSMIIHDDGIDYQIRPIQPSDKAGLIELFDMLSPESRRFRFAHAINQLPKAFIEDVLNADQTTEMAFVAEELTHEGKKKMIGISRYAPTDTKASCEFSLTVADAYTSHGIGSRLLNRLIEHAKEHGVSQLVGYVLTDNIRMAKLVSELGFKRVPNDSFDYQKYVLTL